MKNCNVNKNRSCKLKINMFSLSLLLLLCSFSVKGLNPGRVEGLVVESETSQSAIAAKIELLNAADSTVVKATLSDVDGKYMLQDVPFGKYVLRISGMTYEKQVIPDVVITPEHPTVRFGKTVLLPQTKKLDEVKVVAYKMTGKFEDDKLVYAVSPKSTAMAQSGIDLLKQVPDVSVNLLSNAVSLAGSSNILYQVNGKRVDKDYLMQVNPKMVEKIEVNTNPGSKYDADVDAVINIVLKKNAENGLSGRFNLEAPTADNFFTNNNVNLDYYNKGTHVFLAAWAGGSRWDLEVNNNRNTNAGLANESELNQSALGKTQNKYAGMSYGVDWFLNDKNVLNMYSSIRPKLNSGDEFAYDNLYTSNSLTSRTSTNTKSNYRNFFNDYSLFFKHKFDKKDHEFSLESYFSTGNNSNSLDYNEKTYVGNILPENFSAQKRQLTENDRKQFIFKSDYTLPLTEKIKLSLGYNYNLRRLENNYNEEISSLSNQLTMLENRHSAYGNLSLTVLGINVQTGLRYEYSGFKITQVRDTNNSYHCFLPYASIQFKLGKINSFKVNYRKSIQRPELYQLSPFGNQGDAYTLSIGNPDLSPAYVNKFEFTHRIQLSNPVALSYRPYLSYVNNGIQQVSFTSSDAVVTQRYSNVGKESEVGVTFSGNVNALKWWAFNPSVTLFQRDIKGKPEYGIVARSKSSVRLNISTQFILPKDYVIFVEYSYGSPVLGQQTISRQNYEFVTGVQKKVNNRLSLTVLTINPWTNRYTVNKSTTTAANMVQQNSLVVHYPYVFNIRLSYNFSKGKEGKKLNRDREQDSDAGGKKGIL